MERLAPMDIGTSATPGESGGVEEKRSDKPLAEILSPHLPEMPPEQQHPVCVGSMDPLRSLTGFLPGFSASCASH